MPQRPQKICRKRLCNTLTRSPSGYCDKCEPENKTNWTAHQVKAGNRHQRGYGADWSKLRARAINRNRMKYLSIFESDQDNYQIESFPNVEGKPLQGFCVESFKNNIIRVGTHVDHIISKANGGLDEIENLQVLSKEIHARKTAKERHG